MKPEYYDKTKYTEIIANIKFYHRIDLLIKLSFAAVILLVLLFVQSLWLAIAVTLFFIALKVVGWLYVRALRFIFKNWLLKLSCYNLASEPISGGKVGSYALHQVLTWINEICEKLAISKPAELLVYDSKAANAFASQEKLLSFIMRNRVTILSNVFHLLDEEELKAVIAHEIGHHKHFPKIGVLAQTLIPLFTDRPPYRWCLEHLSDWYAATTIGVIPTANALIKIHHRGHLLREIGKGLSYVQSEFKIGLGGMAEFQEILNDVIPHKIGHNESLDKYMSRVVDKYFERRSTKLKGIGKSEVEKYRKDKSVKTERKVLRSRHKWIDWQMFDDRIKDNTLDREELEKLYLHLKENDNSRFFSSYIEKDKLLDRWRSHPPLRDRIIFVCEAVDAKQSTDETEEEAK